MRGRAWKWFEVLAMSPSEGVELPRTLRLPATGDVRYFRQFVSFDITCDTESITKLYDIGSYKI